MAAKKHTDIGKLIDENWKRKQKRAALNKQAEELKEKFNEVEKEIAKLIKAQNLTSASGKLAKFQKKKDKIVANVEDWPALWNYIIENRATELVQKQIAVTAYREYLKDGTQLPSVKKVSKPDYSLTKLK